MKTSISRFMIATALLFSPVLANAKGTMLNYERSNNPTIAITPGNYYTIGRVYKIGNQEGKVVLQGNIKSTGTFHIPTRKLHKGRYHFVIDGQVLQLFSIS